MADATMLPNLKIFGWSRPSAPTPRLARPISSTDTTIYFTSAPKDEDDAVITAAFLMGVTNRAGYTEIIYCPDGADGASGLSATGCIRGIDIAGIDFSAANTTFAAAAEADSPIFCAVAAVYHSLVLACLRGENIATGGTVFDIGDGTDNTFTLRMKQLSGVKGFLRRNTTLTKIQFSNDGTTWANLDSVSASNLVTVSAADTTPGYLDDKITVAGALSKAITSPAGNEKLELTVSTTVDETYTALEAMVAGAPASASLTADNAENMVISALSTAGADSVLTSNAGADSAGVNLSRNKIALIYNDATGDTNYLAIGTVAADKTITFGSAVELGGDAGGVSICEIGTDKIVVAYKSGSTYLARVATISGTTPTLGATVEVGASDNTGTSVLRIALAKLDTDKFIAAYRADSDTNKGKTVAATVSGTTITLGSAVEFEAGATAHITIAQVDTNKAVVFYMDDDDGDQGKGALLSVSGTVVSTATPVAFEANAISSTAAVQLTTDKAIVVYQDTISGNSEARIASVSGLTLSFPTAATTIGTADAATVGACAVSATEAYACYIDATAGKFNKLTISGTTITAGSQNTFNGVDATETVRLTKVSDSNKVLLSYKDVGNSDRPTATCYQSYDNSTRHIGHTVATVAAAADVSVRSKGIIDNQSGLTAGSSYWLSTTGTLTTTQTDTGIHAGIAKSATELDIQIYEEENYTSAIDAKIAKSLVVAKGDLIGATAASAPAAVTVGTNTFVLRANSAAAAGVNWSYTNRIGTTRTDVTVTNTVTETTLFTVTTDASIILTTNAIRVRMLISNFTILNTSTCTIGLTYGTTAVAAAAITNNSGANIANYAGWIEGVLYANGATNVQEGSMEAFLRTYNDPAGSGIYSNGVGTGAEDSTTSLVLKLTVTWSAASATNSITVVNGHMEIIW